jgi:uncharacterized protein YcbK (DUF882 family)
MPMSRRSFVAGLVSIPAGAGAKPLIDLTSGKGLYSQAYVAPELSSGGGIMDLYGREVDVPVARPTPELSEDLGSYLAQPLRLSLLNVNTDERMQFDVPTSLEFGWVQQRQLNQFLRDWRYDKVKKIDQVVLHDLMKICAAFVDSSQNVDVRITSGYRTQETNDMLRRQSRQVAQNSLHIQGMAIDFSLPGIPNRVLATKSREICGGGVGSYSTFVHIDSGAARRWTA